ncbi:hypothetical protein AgCh_001102 [Apium graveolens]
MKIPILKKADYSIWKVKMLMFLEAINDAYVDIINKGPPYLEKGDFLQDCKRDMGCFGDIMPSYNGLNASRKLRNVSYPLANWELGPVHLIYLMLCDERRKQG